MYPNKILLIFVVSLVVLSCKKQDKSAGGTSVEKVLAVKERDVENLPYFNTPDFAPTWLNDDLDKGKLHKIPEFSFQNQLGKIVTNATFKEKIYIASFFFTTCTNICMQMTDNMRKLQTAYNNENDIMFLSHTVMPSVDNVKVLKEYGERQDINPEKWQLVTGDKDKIYEMAREAYFADDLYKQTQDKTRFVHTENFMLIDKKGHIRGVYDGTLPAELDRIKRHIAMLKKE